MAARMKVQQPTKPHGNVNLGSDLGPLVRFLAWYKRVSVANLLRPFLLKKLKAEFDSLPDSDKAKFRELHPEAKPEDV